MHPEGLPNLTAKQRSVCALANRVTANTVKLCEHFCAKGIPWSVENPHNSVLWWTKGFMRIQRVWSEGMSTVVFDMCRFGKPYRKRTRLLTWHPDPSRKDFLRSLALRCCCTQPHATLGGWGEQGNCIPTGRGSSAYPAPLCEQWAQAVRALC